MYSIAHKIFCTQKVCFGQNFAVQKIRQSKIKPYLFRLAFNKTLSSNKYLGQKTTRRPRITWTRPTSLRIECRQEGRRRIPQGKSISLPRDTRQEADKTRHDKENKNNTRQHQNKTTSDKQTPNKTRQHKTRQDTK